MIDTVNYGDYTLYTLSSEELRLRVCTLGATVMGLRYRGRDCVLAYERPEDYLAGQDYLGATVGRCGNRIAGAAFSLNGRHFALAANEGANQLHGGPEAFDRRVWKGEVVDDTAVRFLLHSPDGDNGYPGNLDAAVTYRVSGSTLRLDFEGICDRDTVFAPTNHMYFNLDGSPDIRESLLSLSADRYVEPGPELIPTGRLLPAEGDFDFHRLRPIARDYDHAFVLSGQPACTLQAGGIRMELHTDFPAVQIYTGAFLKPPLSPRQGVAIEPEFYPDSPHHPDFPSVVLKAGETFRRWAEYRFSPQS